MLSAAIIPHSARRPLTHSLNSKSVAFTISVALEVFSFLLGYIYYMKVSTDASEFPWACGNKLGSFRCAVNFRDSELSLLITAMSWFKWVRV